MLKKAETLRSLIPKIIAPKDAGMKRQKEKLKAWAGLSPRARAVAMVVPARETPGRMAKA